MKIHILLNALDYGDGVSNFCILFKKRCQELGFAAEIYAEGFDPRVADHGVRVDRLRQCSSASDVLIHQLFNDTSLISYVHEFPGKRVLFYQNITPVEFFSKESTEYRACLGGLRLVRSLAKTYDLALGASEFSRRDLMSMGFAETGAFPLFVDISRLRAIRANPAVMGQPRPDVETFVFVGRIAQNKRIDDLMRFLSAYRALGRRARLILVGNDAQCPDYKRDLVELAHELSLTLGRDVIFTGKVPLDAIVSYYRIADAFICMSEHEGFGLPLIESMAFGLPTFAYAATAVEDTMGDAGVLFRSKDFPGVARLVAEVLDDPKRKREVLDSQQRRLEFFSPESDKERIRQLLERVDAIPARAANRRSPKVSVIINTYNRGEYVQRCLESLEVQTYDNFEVVVVNGPSTDDTRERVAQFGPRVRYADTDRRVLSVSRNVGILESRGELIAFLDDDAIAHKDWIREMVFAFEDPEVGAVGGMVYRMNGRDIEFRNGILDRQGIVKWDQPNPGTHWNWEEGYLNTVAGGSCMFRRAALERIGGFDEEIEYYHDEADVVMRLQIAGYKTVHRPLAAIYHEAAKSHNRRAKYQLNWFAVIKNTLYCALKNYTGDEKRRRVALRIAGVLWDSRLKEAVRWWLAREIGAAAFVKIEASMLRGLITGIRRGLRPKAKLRSIPPVPEDAAFNRFAADATCARGISVCLLSQCMPPEAPGGIGTYTATLARALRDSGCTVHVIKRGSEPRSENRGGVWYHSVTPLPLANDVGLGENFPVTSKNVDYSYGVWNKILEIAARWGLDIIESPAWDAEGIIAALQNRIPVAVRMHSPLFKVMDMQGWERTPDLKLSCDVEGALLECANGVYGSTRALVNTVFGHYGFTPERTAIIPLALDVPATPPSINESGTKRVLFVGRLEPRKGIHVLLEAIPRIIAAVPDVVFDIVGKDVPASDAGSLVTRWRNNHRYLEKQVQFHGEVPDSDLPGFYKRCDLFVAPSLYESFGLVFVEAMAHGKPVIGTTAGGMPEVIREGETGLLVPPGDVNALAEAVIRLLCDDSMRARFAHAAHERYQVDFCSQRLAERTLEFYQQVTDDWKRAHDQVWQADALENRRSLDVRVVWDPIGKAVNLLADPGEVQALCYGPYMQLGPGDYRAEFAIAIGDVSHNGDVCDIDVHGQSGRLAYKRLSSPMDFTGGSASVFALHFSVPPTGESQLEFRVHTSGTVSVYLRRVSVTRYQKRVIKTPVFAHAAAGR